MASRKLEVVIVGDSSSLQKALGKANTSASAFGKGLGGHLKNMAKFAAASAGIAGVGLAFSKTAALTVDFDKSMRNVNSIAQLSEKQLGALSKSVLALAGKTGQAPKTLAEGLYDLVSSGFNAKESMVILKSSAKAATAGLTDTATSTKAVAAVLNAYHRPASDAANVSDALFQTVNRGVISFEDLASNIGDVLPFASALHINLNQVGAAVSTMTKEGISAPETMTRIKNVMQAFIKPSKGMTKAIKETGASSGEALVKQKGFQGAIEALIKTTDGSKQSVAKLFPNIRALGGALALTGGNAKSAHKDLAAFKDVTGATDTALKQQSKSVAFQWNKIKATISSLAIQLGSKLIPAVSTAIQWLGKFVAQMKAGTGVPGQIRSAVVSAFNAIKSAITSSVAAVKNIVQGFKDGKTWAVALVAAFAGFATFAAAIKIITAATRAWTAAQLLLDAAMSINPVVAIAAAIIGLGAALVIVYTKCKVFRTVVNAVWSAVKTAAVAAFGLIKSAASKGLLGPIPLIISHWQTAKKVLVGVFNAIKGGIKAAAGVILSMVSTMIGGFALLAHAAGKLPGPLGAPFRKAAILLDAAKAKVDALHAAINGLPSKKEIQIVVHQFSKGGGGGITGIEGRRGAHPSHKAHGASIGSPGGIPTLASLDSDASTRVAGLLFPAVRKGELFEASAKQAVASRRRELVGGRNNATDALKAARDAAGKKTSADERKRIKEMEGNLEHARKKLRDFDADSKTYLSMAHGKAVGLQNIQKFKDAIAGLRDKMHGLATDAAGVFRKGREKAIADGPESKELAALQATDKAAEDAKTTAQLAQDLADAKASGDVKAQKDAQDAIDAYARQKREDELSASIQSQQDGLDAEELAKQASYDAQFQMLTDNLSAGKESYKQYVSDVQAILGPLGIAFSGDPDEEATITPAAPGKKKPKKKAKPKKKRAAGGFVAAGMSYTVGELGQETFTPDVSGHIAQASQSKGGAGGVYIDMRGAKVGSTKAARIMANKLAFRVAFA